MARRAVHGMGYNNSPGNLYNLANVHRNQIQIPSSIVFGKLHIIPYRACTEDHALALRPGCNGYYDFGNDNSRCVADSYHCKGEKAGIDMRCEI